MSQAKVDRYKQEKYNRKNQKQQKKIKKYLSYAAITLVGVAFIVYLGYSVLVSTGLYTPPTDPVTKTQAEIQSLRQTLINSGDQNVENVETTTVAAVGETTVVEEVTKAKKKDKEAVTKDAETKEAE